MDYAGTISAVGKSITDFKPGDRVYGLNLAAGAMAEYMLLSPSTNRYHTIAKIPSSVSFHDAASFPAITHTVIQSLQRANSKLEGGLEGKTVLVTAGLGGAGSLALQLLKNVFRVRKVITTVSTKKVSLVTELLGTSAVDQVVDYSRQDVVTAIGKEKVDFILDTVGLAVAFRYLPVMRKGGLLFSLTGKSGTALKKDWHETPWLLVKILDVINAWYEWRARYSGVRYEECFTEMVSADLDTLGSWVEGGMVKAIVCDTVRIEELEKVRAMLEVVQKGKGGVGKYVVDIASESLPRVAQ